MKLIDIHTKKELYDKEKLYSKPISSELIKNYVFNTIDFHLPDYQWKLINDNFSEYWNNKIGIGGYFYWDEVASFVYNEIQKSKQLITKQRVYYIVDLILSKIEKDGGFMN